jgi:ankyrin repeat protein
MSSKIMTSNFCKKTIGFKDLWTIIFHLHEIGHYDQLHQLFNKAAQLSAREGNERIYNLPDFRTISDVEGCTLIHLACFYNCFSIVDILLQYVDHNAINAQDSDGNTPLHIAAKCRHIEIVNLLIINSANVLIKNKNELLFIEFIVLEGDYNILLQLFVTFKNYCSHDATNELISQSLNIINDCNIYNYLIE